MVALALKRPSFRVLYLAGAQNFLKGSDWDRKGSLRLEPLAGIFPASPSWILAGVPFLTLVGPVSSQSGAWEE